MSICLFNAKTLLKVFVTYLLEKNVYCNSGLNVLILYLNLYGQDQCNIFVEHCKQPFKLKLNLFYIFKLKKYISSLQILE